MASNGLKYTPINAEMNYLLATRRPLRRRVAELTRQRLVDAEADSGEIPELHKLALKPIEITFSLVLIYNALLLQRLLMPELVTDAFMARVFDAFLNGVANSSPRQRHNRAKKSEVVREIGSARRRT
jgi:hypothetical protein